MMKKRVWDGYINYESPKYRQKILIFQDINKWVKDLVQGSSIDLIHIIKNFINFIMVYFFDKRIIFNKLYWLQSTQYKI